MKFEMKIILSALSILLLVANIAKAQTGPTMKFDKTEIDYGNIVQGSDGIKVFRFTNTGTEPLIIKNARGSCGCTVPKWPGEPIKPGQTATIEVKYDASKLGSFSKTVTVETNEAVGKHVLTIKGNVYEKKFESTSPNSSGRG